MVGMPEQVLSLPFEGRWLVQNSPARRVPSHGTDMLGQRYAIDFVGVDEKRRSASRRDWRTFLATEPTERSAGRSWRLGTVWSSRSTTARSTTRPGARL